VEAKMDPCREAREGAQVPRAGAAPTPLEGGPAVGRAGIHGLEIRSDPHSLPWGARSLRRVENILLPDAAVLSHPAAGPVAVPAPLARAGSASGELRGERLRGAAAPLVSR